MNIGITYILYNPNIETLLASINSIYTQVNKILFIDNGSNNQFEIESFNTHLVPIDKIYLYENTGIANATNIAIDYFIKLNFDYIIISDQDTIYHHNYISTFKNKVDHISLENIAAFVPSVDDTISNSIKPFYIKKGLLLKKIVVDCDAFVYQSIASGMIINLLCIKVIGLMNTDLFIDYVDFEWCWRVHYYNWKIIAIPSMIIYHQLGDSVKRIGNKYVHIHKPIREYYIVRNVFYLSLNSPYIGIVDRSILFFKALLIFIGYVLLSNDIKTSFGYCLYGFIDGVNGKLGACRRRIKKR
jgi:rhamnosyltransferase